MTKERRAPTQSEQPGEPHPRQQIGARISTMSYRQLKAYAALQGLPVATVVEQAVSEFLENHSRC